MFATKIYLLFFGSGTMSRLELLVEIERLRSAMYTLAEHYRNNSKLLEISRRLDELIVEYQKAFV
ncbi:aspartyl-phosphate phosphatase Spo0E family protein [Candidatus Gracilibacteria bacterium]|nr:aspartyl-phosphate phosphatase Spo0E family protein [Candidatus Gracilibacteria bacterium]